MKLNYLALVLLFLPLLSIAQAELKFDKIYFECEDKYVAFPLYDDETDYSFGFIYLDEQAGFTYQVIGDFKIDENGKYIADTSASAESNIKLRLEPNTKDVAIIPNEKVLEMGFPLTPYWLKFYKANENKVQSLIKRGYHFNHVGACNIALINLEEAYKIEPHAKGLEFEMSYAYNHLKEYDKAVAILEKAIENNPKDYFFYRELGFSYSKMEKLDEAEKVYKRGIKMSDDNAQKAEMAINMAQAYTLRKNEKKFKEWAKVVKKYADKDSDFVKMLARYEEYIHQ